MTLFIGTKRARTVIDYCRFRFSTSCQDCRQTPRKSIRDIAAWLGFGGGVLTAFGTFTTKAETNEDLNESQFMAKTVSDLSKLKQNKDAMRTRMELMILKVQADFCKSLQEFDDKEFIVDKWAGKRGSGGVSCIIQNGTVFEKAAILTSVVHGHLSDNAAERLKKRRSDIRGTIIQYFAAGLSVVIHPRNPMIPTFHCNFRYFEIIDEHDKRYWWFGGGVDLTPYYLDVDDVKYFHKTLKYACDTYNPKFYPEFKQQCDRYFYIEHRHERRGVGGIFFDDLDCLGPQGTFEFVKTCAQSIIPCYSAVVKKHLTDAYGNAERQWQLLRRGRYAEFNLIYDRGTKFGLNTPESRVESVLASLPLEARWDYKHSPLPGSKEAELIKVLVKPKDWVTDED